MNATCAANRAYGIFDATSTVQIVMITPAQIRAARALLDWTRETLAQESGVGLRSLVRIEAGEVTPQARSLHSIQEALERAGVQFLPDDGVAKPL